MDTAAIRELAKQLAPPSQRPLQLMQGVIVSVQGFTCTMVVQGDDPANAVPGWTWLIDAYTPQAGDVVWCADGGPSQRFILGVTRLSSVYRWMSPRGAQQHYINGRSDFLNNHTNWPTNIFSSGTTPSNSFYNLSSAGATSAELRYTLWLNRGTYRFVGVFLKGPNIGTVRVEVGTAVLSTVDMYNAAYSWAVYQTNQDINIDQPGYYTIKIVKTGLKNAAASDYYCGFQDATLQMVALY